MTDSTPSATKPHTLRHGPSEDALAFVTGTMAVALGLYLLQRGELATGGTAGLALLLHHATGWSLGGLFFAVNLPFYIFAQRALGTRFTLNTFAAVALLSAETALLPHFISVSAINPIFAAVMGGLLIGMGILALVRHKASLGGVGVLAIYLQERRGWSAGKVQMAVDCLIVASAFFVMEPVSVMISVLGAIVLNLVLAMNHRPGRYLGF